MPDLQSTPPPPPPPLQYRLRTLLLLFVVLGSSLAVFGGWGIVVFGLVLGLAIYLRKVKSLRSLWYLPVVVLCLVCLFGLSVLFSVEEKPLAGRTAICPKNLEQIALALQSYHQAHGSFPPAYIADGNGKPMHSWRVLILPYMGEDSLYKAYDFTEPWDGPKNKKLLAMRPSKFACPSDPMTFANGANQTSYVAVVGLDGAWAGEKPSNLGLADSAEAPEKTIMIVEVANSTIPWTAPRDLSLDSLGESSGSVPVLIPSSYHDRREEFFFTSDYGSAVHVAMADGKVRILRIASLSTDELRKTLQIGGAKERYIGDRGYYAIYVGQRHLNWPNIAALAVWLLSVGTLLIGAVRSRKKVVTSPPPAC